MNSILRDSIVLIIVLFVGCGVPVKELRVSESLSPSIDQDLDCYLYLKGDKYWMELTSTEEDQTFCQTFSQGKIVREKKKMRLIDEYNGFSSILLKQGRKTEVVHSFPFLSGKHFLPTNDYSFDIEFINNETNYDKIICEVHDRQSTHLIPAEPLKQCLYKSLEGAVFNYQLNIEDNQNYQFYMYNLLVSEGKWTREGNLLKLYNSENVNPYYLFIEKEKLVGCLLPDCSIPDSYAFLYIEDVPSQGQGK